MFREDIILHRYPCLPHEGEAKGPLCGPSDHREEVMHVRLYELTVILVAELEDHKAAAEEIAEVVRGLGAEVEKVDLWGKKRFAYPIKKQQEGFYAMITMKAPADQIRELDRVLGLRQQVLRHLVVSLDEE
jgi:small subunit ribosomal protein S6